MSLQNNEEKTKDEKTAVIDKTIPTPLYYQLINLIYDKINRGELKPGDALPTESELKKTYGLSQTTIRRAISELVHENVVEARRPKGVFVRKPPAEEYSNGLLTSFTEEFQRIGYKASGRILKFETVPTYEALANELKVEPGQWVRYIYRLRYLNDEPASLNMAYISNRVAPNLQREDFTETGESQSLYYVLREKYGIKLARAIETVSAVLLDRNEADLLNAASGTPVITRKRLIYGDEELPVVLEKSILRYAYKNTLVGK